MDPVSSEIALEQACKKMAEAHGCLLLKIQGARGYPDRLLLRPNGTSTFIEFKRPGGSLHPLQKHIMKVLRTKKFQVEEVDNKELFMNLLKDTSPANGSPQSTKSGE